MSWELEPLLASTRRMKPRGDEPYPQTRLGVGWSPGG
jgi:hypothetical protein